MQIGCRSCRSLQLFPRFGFDCLCLVISFVKRLRRHYGKQLIRPRDRSNHADSSTRKPDPEKSSVHLFLHTIHVYFVTVFAPVLSTRRHDSAGACVLNFIGRLIDYYDCRRACICSPTVYKHTRRDHKIAILFRDTATVLISGHS